MTEPTVNIPLLRKAVEWAEAEAAKPAELCEWEQSKWRMTRADRDQYALDYPAESFPNLRLAVKAPECGTCYCIAGYVAQTVSGDVDEDDISSEARDALGLTFYQGDDLFGGSNTIADVRRIAEDIAGERL